MRVKIVVFVPVGDADAVRQALGAAGAGRIGAYEYCSYSVLGTGRFRPTADARPAIGSVGEFESVAEERIEVLCEHQDARHIIDALRLAHPYEEPAIDIYPLLDESDL